ncbi:peptidylprolyl isomerase [Devosia sp.]|uniref:peptidylprolyl isomerase n=1 Tax=Devosia sp. TaxID=1871048 RepID=UPI001AC0F68C|nr:peptidylprolyl isomerase [Devosia sp.]MBN9308839.1 peptidylprolyl isomerase [Devosia sp.]
MTHLAPQGFRHTLKTLAGTLLLGTTLGLMPLAALAQDAAAPAAPAAAAPAAPAAPAQPDPAAVVATVGDMSITEADLQFAAEDLQQQLQQVPPADRRAFLVTVLIDMKVMAKAAREAGLADADMFKRRMSYLEDRSLRRDYFTDKIATSITEDAIKAAYDDYVKNFVPVEEVHARHILVATEDEAKAIKAELDAGKPFEVLAMEKTTDPSGKQNGGDLGFFQKGMMVPEFEAVAFTLEPGKVSDPVKSQFGWHIIKVEEKRMSAPTPMEQLSQQLSQQVMLKAFDDTMATLKTGLAINIPDAALAEAVKKQSEPASEGEAGTQ